MEVYFLLAEARLRVEPPWGWRRELSTLEWVDQSNLGIRPKLSFGFKLV